MKYFFFFFCFLHLSGIACAQTDTLRSFSMQDAVIVTANRTGTQVREIGSSLSIIKREDILASTKLSLYELLTTQPGMQFYRAGGPGQLATAAIRAGNSGDVVIFIDGVKMNMPNDAANTVDISMLGLGEIERIEILRGPQSTLYGSDAVAGVISIFSSTPAKSFKSSVYAETGSYRSLTTGLTIANTTGAFSYSFGAGRSESAGFSSAAQQYGNKEPDGVKKLSFDAGVAYFASDALSFRAGARFTASDVDLDQMGGKGGDDSTYVGRYEEFLFHAGSEYKAENIPLTLSAGASFIRNLRKYQFDPLDAFGALSRSRYDGNREKYETKAVVRLAEKEVTTLGIEYEVESALSYYFYFSPFYSFISELPQSRHYAGGFYFQHQSNPLNSLFITAGGRVDRYNRFGSVTTYRISPAYYLSAANIKFRGAIGTSFKAPSLFYLYDPSYGNTLLKPEKSRSAELGFDHYAILNHLEYGATFFTTAGTDLFGFEAATFKTININEAKIKGVELYANISPMREITVKVNYSFTETKNLSSRPTDRGMPLLRRPKNKANLEANVKMTDRISLNAEILFTGARFDKEFDFITGEQYVRLPDYTLVNTALSCQVSESLTLYARLENLFNRQYEEILGYGTPGFSVYAGIRLTNG